MGKYFNAFNFSTCGLNISHKHRLTCFTIASHPFQTIYEYYFPINQFTLTLILNYNQKPAKGFCKSSFDKTFFHHQIGSKIICSHHKNTSNLISTESFVIKWRHQKIARFSFYEWKWKRKKKQFYAYLNIKKEQFLPATLRKNSFQLFSLKATNTKGKIY